MEFLKFHKLREDEDNFRKYKKGCGSGRPRKVGEDCEGGERPDEGSDWHLKRPAQATASTLNEPQTPPTQHIQRVFIVSECRHMLSSLHEL